MIRMLSGWTRIDGKVVTPDDGPFSASRSIEKRLVICGVAEYVDEAPEDPVPAEEPDLPEAEDMLDEDQLKKLTNDELKDMAESMGLDTGSCRKKADYIRLILEGEGDDAPDNSVEEPVV